MPRDVTVTFEDGSTHVYRGVPDEATPDQVTARASQEFRKGISSLDGGRNTEIPSSGPGEPRRGRYMMQADREKQYRMQNPQPSNMFDMNPSGSTDMAKALGGAGEAAISMGTGFASAPVAGLAGAAVAPFSGQKAADIIARVQQALTYEPRTEAGQQAAHVASYPFEKLAQGGYAVGAKVSDATDSPLLGAAANTAFQSIPSLLARGTVRRGSSSVDRPGSVLEDSEIAPRPAAPAQAGRNAGLESVPAKPPAPSIEELQAAKDAAYKAADNTGIVVSRGALNRLKVGLVNDLKKEGLNRKLHPKAAAALEEIVNTKGQLSLSEIETLRKIANDAKGSLEPADARLGSKIVDHIDDFEEGLSQRDVVGGNADAAGAYKEARSLNTRLSKAKTIDELFRRAELNAPNFSGSGMENALRTEFRALAKNKREIRRFSPEERVAIEKVAKGAPMENLLRQVGKLAPTGIVSFVLGQVAGAAIGGPAGMTAVPAVGFAARSAATRMTKRNANAVSEMVRRGSQRVSQPQPEEVMQ